MDDLPTLSLEDTPEQQTNTLGATGTDNRHASSLAPNLAPTRCKLSHSWSVVGKATENDGEDRGDPVNVASLEEVKRNESLSIADNDSCKSGRLAFV